MDSQKELSREAFEEFEFQKRPFASKKVLFQKYNPARIGDCDGNEGRYYCTEMQEKWEIWQHVGAQAVPEGFVLVPKQQRKGGYYLWDIRSPIGNCMKFWYTNDYGTKLEKFHWFPTLEDALSSRGGAGWFKPWYAPYIDSIAEKTIDFQLADRSKEKAMIKAAEGK